MSKCNCGTNWNNDGVCMEWKTRNENYDKLADAEGMVVKGKTLKDWATSNPVRLEQMFENEFDEVTRNKMLLVYKKYCIALKEKY